MPRPPSTPTARAQTAPVRIRVIDYRLVPASELVINDANPRRHPPEQKAALAKSLRSIGFAGAELTRLLPDGRLQLIDGEARHDLTGAQPIPCLVTDLSAAEADQLLAE